MLTYWRSSRALRLPRRRDGRKLEIKITAGIAVRVALNATIS
jgi:hypothetical protein